ncbi:MAG TPA: tetratricopeptide repeat protein, partial [Methylomirabilota bacterium]
NPAGYHLSSLLLHAATALAFYFLALRLLRAALPPSTTLAALRWGAAVAALVFAVHPLRVESVASATERRDVLSGLFYVLALLCYVKAATASAETAPARLEPRWYALALACFAAALLSKSIVVTLPVTLLVLDVYPLRRLGGAAGWRAPRPWLDKLPFFALSAITAIVAFEALLPLGNTKSLQDMPVMVRLLVSVYGLLFYLQKTLLPLDLSPLYPLSFEVTWLQFGVLIAGACLAWACRRRAPAFTAAGFVYVVTVAPVIGIFQNGPQAAADRYTYLPCLGWAALAGGAVAHWWPRRAIVVPVAAAWLAALAFLTWQQTSLWKDPVSLWSQAAAVTPTMRAAHFKLAQAHAQAGRIAEAIAAYREAIRLSGPRAPWGHVAIARLLEQAGLDDAARAEYAEALREDPAYQEACDGLIQMGKPRGGQALALPSCEQRG